MAPSDTSPVAGPIRGTQAMIAHMSAQPSSKRYVYTHSDWETFTRLAPQLQPLLHSLTVEPEGLSLLVEAAAVPTLLPPAPDSPLLAHITLMVHSALEGVGLTAAVASALTASHVPCNVVAGLRHDHLFVPAEAAETALAALEELSANARRSWTPE